MLAAQVALAEGDRLAQGELERLLGARGERDHAADSAAPAAPPADERAGSEGPLDALADRVEVDAQRGQGVAVDVVLAAADDAHDVVAHAGGVDAEAGQQPRPIAVGAQHAEQEVLGADPAVAQGHRLLLSEHDGLAGVLGEALEHQPSNLLRRPCLRCTACLDTPSARADLLPRPAALARVGDVQLLQALDEVAQRGDGGKPDLRIGAVDVAGEIAGLLCGHGVNIR